jgi:hypothetical protein
MTDSLAPARRPRRARSRTKGLVIAAAVVGVVAAGGAAFAYWTGSGSGSGSGAAASGGSVTLTGTLAPGIAPGLSRKVTLTAANPGESAITVKTVQLVGVTADSAHADCAVADFSMAPVTEDHSVPAGATAEPLPNQGTLVYESTSANQDACKGATLTLNLASS